MKSFQKILRHKTSLARERKNKIVVMLFFSLLLAFSYIFFILNIMRLLVVLLKVSGSIKCLFLFSIQQYNKHLCSVFCFFHCSVLFGYRFCWHLPIVPFLSITMLCDPILDELQYGLRFRPFLVHSLSLSCCYFNSSSHIVWHVRV